ncbi:MAG: ImmA/IrrE family metallo-endopeptidase [Leptolyngbya sp. DLM2.Bin15]|nr:MAG: ImmA/IrrE family metallo-endopeptidase [Leptolyngbya sp. DLM2.Bin15]
MAGQVVGIQPKVLRWARDRAGYSVEDIANQLKRDPAEVRAWETGDAAPTYAQLEKLAYDLYKRPLALFFLPEPPQEADVKQEFRTLPNAEMDQLLPNTRYLLRLGQAFQLSLKELTEGINPSEHKIFKDIKLTDAAQIPSVAQRVREYLEIPMDTQSDWGSTDEALKAWRNAVETAGVFVFKQSFKQKTISGFCLIDAEFPIIVINNSTTKTRQIFTLFHELSHLLVGVNSISKVDDAYIDELPSQEKRIEQICNALAAEILVPSKDFLNQVEQFQILDDNAIQALANRYRVSREVILRLSLKSGDISQAEYTARISQWASKNGASSRSSAGGSYYATQATYLGDNYLQLVFSKYYQGKIDIDQVAEHLGIKAKNVADLEAQFSGRGSAA